MAERKKRTRRVRSDPEADDEWAKYKLFVLAAIERNELATRENTAALEKINLGLKGVTVKLAFWGTLAAMVVSAIVASLVPQVWPVHNAPSAQEITK